MKAQANRFLGAHSRVVVLVNAAAGACTHEKADALRRRLLEGFRHSGLNAELEILPGDELHRAAQTWLARALQDDIDAIVIGGGDGSIRCVAGVLADTTVPLGVLPLGTLNHFAKDAGIPVDLGEAIALIAGGGVRAVDLAEVNGEVFVNNSSIGLYPSLVIGRELIRRKHRLSKWTALLPASLQVLRRFPRRDLTICAREKCHFYRTPCLFVGNNEYAVEPVSLGRRHRLDAGALWFYVVKPLKPVRLLWALLNLLLGKPARGVDIDTFQLDEAEVKARARKLPVALDGEVRVMETPLRYRSRPKALQVIAPGIEALRDLRRKAPPA